MKRPLLAGSITLAIMAMLWGFRTGKPEEEAAAQPAAQSAAAPAVSTRPGALAPVSPRRAASAPLPPSEGKPHRPAVDTVLPPPAEDIDVSPVTVVPQAIEDADYAGEGFESMEEMRQFAAEKLGVRPEQITLRAEVHHGTEGTRIIISAPED
jgi:hypothetical protein